VRVKETESQESDEMTREVDSRVETMVSPPAVTYSRKLVGTCHYSFINKLKPTFKKCAVEREVFRRCFGPPLSK